MKIVRYASAFGALTLLASTALSAQAPARAAGETGDWAAWLSGGHYWLNARLRYEDVDQDGIGNRANALTLRTVLGMETREWHGLTGTLEFEDVTALFDESYNSTTNGNTQFPIVLDPEGAEINQAFLQHAKKGSWEARVGRQRVTFDNHRFVGNVGWRQNEQTFDAVKLVASDVLGVEAAYVYVDNVNRVNGDASPVGDMPSKSHLVHLARGIGPVGSLSVYAYLLESDRFDANTLNTYGARLTGKRSAESGGFGVQWTGETAYQKDGHENPNDVEETYLCGELGASLDRFTLLFGNEVLGGSGQAGGSFQTPLATLHSFNGWADKFLTTPDDGIDDRYVSLEVKVGQGKGQLAWHDFHAERGDDRYGDEFDAAFTWQLRKELLVGVKAALYDASSFATDTEKFWLWASLSL